MYMPMLWLKDIARRVTVQSFEIESVYGVRS